MAVDSNANDELLQLKKRARRRLVGAVALMVVALLVLSFVMGTRPAPVEKPEPIAIDGLKTNTVVPAGNAFAKPPLTAMALASEPVASPVVNKIPAKPEKPVAVEAVPKTPKATKPKNEPTPAKELVKTVAPVKEKPKKEVTPPPVKKDVSKSEGGKTHSSSVAALSDPNKAAELQRKLSAHGLKAYTEKVEVGGKTLTRVKVGPYESAAELEKAKAKLSLMGL